MKLNLLSRSILPIALSLIASTAFLACKGEADKKTEESHQEQGHEKEGKGEHEGEESSHEEGSAEIGEASISLASAKLIGLQMAVVQSRPFASESPLSGRIAVARERTQQVVPRHGGTIISIPVTLGSKVNAGDTLVVLRNPETMATYAETASQAGTVIDQQSSIGEVANGLVLTVADLNTVWLEIPVPERMSMGLKKGMRGAIVPDSKNQDSQTPIFIDYVSPMLDPETRTQTIRATLGNGYGKWKPGQMLKVVLYGTSAKSALAIPSTSVQTWNGKRMVFSREADTVFAAMEIVIGKEMGGWTEVVSGLSQGDSVVAQGAFELKSKLATANMGDGHNH